MAHARPNPKFHHFQTKALIKYENAEPDTSGLFQRITNIGQKLVEHATDSPSTSQKFLEPYLPGIMPMNGQIMDDGMHICSGVLFESFSRIPYGCILDTGPDHQQWVISSKNLIIGTKEIGKKTFDPSSPEWKEKKPLNESDGPWKISNHHVQTVKEDATRIGKLLDVIEGIMKDPQFVAAAKTEKRIVMGMTKLQSMMNDESKTKSIGPSMP